MEVGGFWGGNKKHPCFVLLMLDLLFIYEEKQACIFHYVNNRIHILVLLFVLMLVSLFLIRKDLYFFCDCI